MESNKKINLKCEITGFDDATNDIIVTYRNEKLKIKDKEKGRVSDDALKLIVKISEGSVRDALSLLDRGLLSLKNNEELDLNLAQKIFGYFDKSQLIDLFEYILEGNQNKVIQIYRKIYDLGVEPKIFINDFLELIYYFKNINLLTPESTNFSLNDNDFSKIKKISNNIENDVLILFWQFTITTLDEIDIVSNQNLSIEMFLLRLLHLKSIKSSTEISRENFKKEIIKDEKISEKPEISSFSSDVVNQIKNVSQEKKFKLEAETDFKFEKKIKLSTFDQLLNICTEKKEIKLKYELEKNVNLVGFENNRIEISFNDDLDKNFVKDLSTKLFEWTQERWIITLTKKKGELSIKEKQNKQKLDLIESAKNSDIFKIIKKKFPDANLIDVKKEDEN